MTAPRATFPKRIRLRRRREYLTVQRGGRRVTTTHFILFGRRNGRGWTRLGVTVSRKVGKAHHRNRIKRLSREAFRCNQQSLPVGLDLVMVARPGPCPTHADVVSELLTGVARLQTASRRRRGGRRKGS